MPHALGCCCEYYLSFFLLHSYVHLYWCSCITEIFVLALIEHRKIVLPHDTRPHHESFIIIITSLTTTQQPQLNNWLARQKNNSLLLALKSLLHLPFSCSNVVCYRNGTNVKGMMIKLPSIACETVQRIMSGKLQ